MKHNKIVFRPMTESASFIQPPPKPMSRFLPKWYKDTAPFNLEGEPYHDIVKVQKKSFEIGVNWHATYKQCVPVVDAMTSGYTISLPASILVTYDEANDIHTINWNVQEETLDAQSSLVLADKYPIPFGHSPTMFRWHNDWRIETPKGYSVLFMHPAHRHDLPFITLTGIIDTDAHPNSVFIPFFLRRGFEGIIPEGTPVAQVIPLKRDAWKSEIKEFDPKEVHALTKIKQSFIKGYRNKFWSKKVYR